ncbi:MAG: type II secretion system F family protein [Planctomycetota bacterium]
MPDFAYVARNTSGEKTAGSINAASQREAVSLLAGQSLFPLRVTAETPKRQSRGGRVKGQTMAVTYAQLASLLRAGVPLLRALEVIRKQSSNQTLNRVLGEVRSDVEQGSTLGDAVARYPRVFSEMAINMIKAGGEGGFLEEALDRVAQFTEQQEDLKAQTVGALAYPAFLASVGTLIVAALIIFFVPQFEELFESLRERGELPLLTDWLLSFSKLSHSWGLVLLGLVIFAGFGLKAQMATENGRRLRDRIKLGLPLLGVVFKNLAVARFCRVLGTLLRNGVPILMSLEISRDTSGNRVLSEAIEHASENISAGESLAAPLAASGHFPITVVEMISVAEESNTLDNVLIEIADGLEKRTRRRLELAVRLLEPILLLVLAGAVLFVVIALLMPVIKMSSTI